MHFFRPVKSLLLAVALALACAPAWSQPSGARGDDFLYRIMANDTLEQLALRFTEGRSVWPRLQQYNQVADPYRLVIGRVLRIPFSLIPELPSTAKVNHVAGRAQAEGRLLGVGDEVGEGDTVRTALGGSATLELADGSLVSVEGDSTLAVNRLRVFKGTGITDSVIHIERGSVESRVDPQKQGVGRFEVRTPITITGVRGTGLRVHASAEGVFNEVVEGQAAVDASGRRDIAVKAGHGVAFNQAGESSGVRPLLPAPALSAPERGAGGWVLDFPAVPGAQSYLLRITADELGTQLVSSRRFSAPPVSLYAAGAGRFYAFVRALDEIGLGGVDASREFEGSSGLVSSDGAPVLSGFGEPVALAQY